MFDAPPFAWPHFFERLGYFFWGRHTGILLYTPFTVFALMLLLINRRGDPARWLLLDKWNSMARIDKVAEPILVVHGGRDGVVPQRFGRKLFAVAHEPKEALWLDSGGHNDLWNYPEVRRTVLEFLETRLPAAKNP